MLIYRVKLLTSCIPKNGLCGLRGPAVCHGVSFVKIFCYALLVVAAVEFIIINILVFYAFNVVSNELSEIQPKSNNDGFFERLHRNKKIRNLVSNARDGGFLSMLQDTVERLYIAKESRDENLFKNADKMVLGSENSKTDFYSFGMDVSHSGESSFIYKRILSRNEFPYQHLIVDIGANDGFISSNSFNFIQFGWNAVLVEPQIDQITLAKKNLKRYIKLNRDPPHTVSFVQAAIGRRDGHVHLLKKAEPQESYVLSLNDPALGSDRVVQVPSLSVKSLAARYSIPKNFGILSIDAEGKGYEILQQWFALKFTPAYIIFETLHIKEPLRNVAARLEKNHYVFIGTRGWNAIYEHNPPKIKRKVMKQSKPLVDNIQI